jgi:outer membrane protein assembly factor BamE
MLSFYIGRQDFNLGSSRDIHQNTGIFMAKQLLIVFVLFLSSCVYTLDIQQGNILAQKDIDKLRPELSKNQVVFVLGNPVVDDSFTEDKWIYLYSYQSRNDQQDRTQKLILYFENDKLVAAEGDFEIPETLQRSK